MVVDGLARLKRVVFSVAGDRNGALVEARSGEERKRGS